MTGLPISLALLTSEQMRKADRRTIGAGTPGYTLMERAGGVVAQEIMDRFEMQPTLVLAGSGHNGGDGFIVARELARKGWPVRVALLGERGMLKDDVKKAAQSYSGEIEPLSPAGIPEDGLIVDALFGTGLTRPIGGVAKDALAMVAARMLPVVAVDLPSGVSADTGQVMGYAAPARLTVTFARKKIGHSLLPGRQLCGEVVVADIGISDSALADSQPHVFENDPELWIAAYPWPRMEQHKYDRGHALVAGGGIRKTGAARVAARAALRSGAGAVTVLCDEESLPVYALAFEAVMTEVVHDDALPAALNDARRSAVLIGPGFGVNERTRRWVIEILESGKRVVLDADALSAFEQNPSSLFQAIRTSCILTPHEGEFARLFGQTELDLSLDKISRVREAAALSGAVVILKGADTVIAHPDGRAAVNLSAPAWLATAGAGDVLAGLCLGLMAQGMEPFLSACAAVWMHAAAADTFGAGLIAEDLPELIPSILTDLEEAYA